MHRAENSMNKVERIRRDHGMCEEVELHRRFA
jgi:hypothetical protein